MKPTHLLLPPVHEQWEHTAPIEPHGRIHPVPILRTLLKYLRARWPGLPPKLSVYCDGSSHERPGRPGGWAFAIVRDGACLHSASGGVRASTSNGMELLSALHGLECLLASGWQRNTQVELVSDSRVTLDVANGGPLPRHDRLLAEAVRAKCVEAGAAVRWVRGHSGDQWNEFVDSLAHEAKQSRVPRRARLKAEQRQNRRRRPSPLP